MKTLFQDNTLTLISTESSQELLNDNSLREYSSLKGHRSLFSSKEWVQAYLETYTPQLEFLIAKIEQNYCVFMSNKKNKYIFVGDEFNDFNLLQNVHSIESDLSAIVTKIESILTKKILWTGIYENNEIQLFNNDRYEQCQTICVKIDPTRSCSFQNMVAKRIKKLYEKKDQWQYKRVYGREAEFQDLLDILLSLRFNKLNTKKLETKNRSYELDFNRFIIKVCSNLSIANNVFLDCVFFGQDPIGLALYFIKEDSVMCYVRSHVNLGNSISPGLALDYWSAMQNDEQHITLWDFTRGDEDYKFRLGGVPYFIHNYVKK